MLFLQCTNNRTKYFTFENDYRINWEKKKTKKNWAYINFIKFTIGELINIYIKRKCKKKKLNSQNKRN